MQEGEVCSCQRQSGGMAGQQGGRPNHAQSYGNRQPINGGGQQMNGGSNMAGGQQMNGGGNMAGGQPMNGSGNMGGGQQMNGGGNMAGGQQVNGSGNPYGQNMGGQQPYGNTGYGSTVDPMQFDYERQQMQQAMGFVQSIFYRVLKVAKRPVTEGVHMIQEADTKSAFALIILQALFSGLFACLNCKKIGDFVFELFSTMAAAGGASLSDLLGELQSSGLGSLGLGIQSGLKVPYGRILLVTVLASVALSCVLALLLWVGNMIVKNHVTYTNMISVVAIRSVVLIPITLLACIVSLLVPQKYFGIGQWVFFLGGLWGLAVTLLAMDTCNHGERKDGLALMVFIVSILFIVITVWSMRTLWTQYLPDLLKSSFEMLDSMNWTDLLQKIMQESL